LAEGTLADEDDSVSGGQLGRGGGVGRVVKTHASNPGNLLPTFKVREMKLLGVKDTLLPGCPDRPTLAELRIF